MIPISSIRGDGMAEYHVRCGLCDIYAGTLKSNGEEWRNESVVTDEAINAVAQYMLNKIKDGETAFAYAMTHNGKYLRLKLEVSDTLPKWVNE